MITSIDGYDVVYVTPVIWAQEFNKYVQKQRLAGLTPNLNATNMTIELANGKKVVIMPINYEDLTDPEGGVSENNTSVPVRRGRDFAFRGLR